MDSRAQPRRHRVVLLRAFAAALLLHLALAGILVGIGAWTVAGRTASPAPQHVIVELIAAAPAVVATPAPAPASLPTGPSAAEASRPPAAPEPPLPAVPQPAVRLPPLPEMTGAHPASEAQPSIEVESADVPHAAAASTSGVVAPETSDDDDPRLAWERRLLAHLDRHKRYPSRAQWFGQEGVVQLEVRAGRDGQVLGHRVVGGSGHVLLDAEALALILRAEPLPPPPPQVGERDLEFRVPVEFFIEQRTTRSW